MSNESISYYTSRYSGEEIDRRLGNAVVLVSNPNLLDNWYLVGGGSQQGGGQFPVNQGALPKYSDNWTYTIDRWRKVAAGTVTVKPYAVAVPKSEVLWQPIEQALYDYLVGKTVTVSLLLHTGELISGSGTIPAFGSPAVIFSNDRVVMYFVANDESKPHFAFNNSSEGTLHYCAAKVELGDHQTLARQTADGKWVLNDPPPNFQQELAKCQRYYWPSDVYFASRQFYSDTHLICNVQFPVKMRSIPAVTLKNGNDLNRVGYWTVGTTLDVPAYANAIKDDGFDSVEFGGAVDNNTIYAFAVIADARL